MKWIPKKHMRDFKHPLVTRRDFLTHGVLAFGAVAALPSFLSKPTWAAGLLSCSGGAETSNMIPFMAFDMAGGASLPGNFLVGKRGGAMDLLASYDTLGWNPRETGALNTDFGLPMSAKYSQILAGILQNASAGARANFRMGSFCHRAEFDRNTNPLNSSTIVLKAGYRGTYITNGCGVIDSLTGGNSAGIQEGPLYKPVVIGSVSDLLSSTNYGGSAFNGFGPQKLTALAQGAVDLSNVQKSAFANLPGGESLAQASVCSYEKSLDFLSGVEGMDPRQDAIAQAVYQINANTSPSELNAVTASLSMNVINGYTGPSTWTLGNCDYHTGSSVDGDRQDLIMGQQIGLAIEYAFRKQKPFFFQLITDGGNAAQNGTRDWSADDAERCMTVVGYFDPKGAPKMRRTQIGQFTDGQGADTSSLIGGEPSLVAYAVFANYLNLCGRLGDFSTLAPGVFADAKALDSVLLFEGRG